MGSREEALEAENGRLVSEMATLKKKIMVALKKQQAELQAKIQAAEQRAMAAEAAAAMRNSNSSSPVAKSSSEEARSDVEVNSSVVRSDELSNGEAEDEIARGEIDQLRSELCQLKELLEEERKKQHDLETSLSGQLDESRHRIEELSKANEKMEAQLLSAAQQVSDTFSRVAEMHEKIETLSKERDVTKLVNERLSLEHDRMTKELQAANEDVALKAKEMQEMLASHKTTQEGQEAAMVHLMQQMQPIEASTRKDLETSFDGKSSIEIIEEQKQLIGLLEEELRKFKAQLSIPNESLSSEKEVDVSSSSDVASLQERNSFLEADLSAAQEQMQKILQEHQQAIDSLENQLKDRDDKYAELDLKFNRLQKRAKQRIQETQKEKDEIAIQLSSAQAKEAEALAKHSTMQGDLERFRAQAGDAIRALDGERQNLRNANAKLKEEIDDVKRALAARDQNVEELEKLVLEKEQSVLSMHADVKEVQQRHGATILEIEQKHKKIVDTLQSQLAEATLETNKLAETISNLQALLVEKESKLTDVEATVSGNVARLSAALEAEKRDAEQLRKDQESERQMWKESVAELQSRIHQLDHAYQEMESALAVAKSEAFAVLLIIFFFCRCFNLTLLVLPGQKEIELDGQRQLLSDAERETALAKDEVGRLNKEFTSYKQRAHALLQKKEAELQAAKNADFAAAQEEILKDAQKQAALAVAERDRAVNSLTQTVTEYETQLAARNVAVVDAEQRIKDLATKLESVKGRLSYEREEWEKHSREQELSWQEKYEELVTKRPADDSIKIEMSALRAQYDSLKDELVNFRDMANKMMEAKDQEIHKLLDDNDSLQKKLQSQPQDNVVKTEPKQQEVVAVEEQQILFLARQQAQREEELKQSQRQIQVLQEELSELERENRVRSQLEALLKNELRNMERAAKRENVDMTYLKNVILKLLETGEVEALLPVVGTLLQFSPDEIKRCQELYAAAAAESPASTPRTLLSRFSFSSSK